MMSLKKALENNYNDIYRQKIYELSQYEAFEVQTVDTFFRQFVNDLLEVKNPQAGDIFGALPDHFLEVPVNGGGHNEPIEKNVFIDPI